MNQPKTSYCRVTFYRSFFEGVYRVGMNLSDSRNGKGKEQEVDSTEGDDIEEVPFLRMQISVKVLAFTRLFVPRLNGESDTYGRSEAVVWRKGGRMVPAFLR